MHFNKKLRVAWVLALKVALVVCLTAVHLAAQTTVGTILGSVTDASGAAVPDATVQVTNSGTTVSQTTMSDNEGRYRVSALPPGDYEVQTEKMGFQTVDHKGLTLTIGSELRVDFLLPVGQVTQTVTVEGEVPQVETTTAQISDLVEPVQMRELPLNGRDFEQLILLAPGVTIMQGIGYTSANGMGNSYSVSGSRGRGQWEILDDNDVMNWQERNSGSGVLGTSLGVDAIAEFQILTNTYSAQYGGNGAVVNSVTKSGTDAFHGSGYEFLRNSALDSRNFFDPPTIPEFQKNQFGGTLGGPIKKNKMFFFANYEGLRQNSNPPYAFTIPDDAAHSGMVPNTATGVYSCVYGAAFTTNAACAAQMPAVIAKFMQYFPQASNYPGFTANTTSGGVINGLDTAFITIPSPGSENFVVGRYDWAISSKDSMFARYLFDKGYLFDVNSTPVPSPLAPTGWSTTDNTKNQFLSIEEKRIWSSDLISSTRVGYSRTLLSSFLPANESYDQSLWETQGTNTYGFPAAGQVAISIPPLTNANFPRSTLGTGGGSKIIQNKFSGGEDIFRNKGAHGLRFGASIIRVQSYKFAAPGGGTWAFSNMTSFLTDSPTNFGGTCLVSVFPVTCNGFSSAAVSPHEFENNQYGVYFQDDWKVRNTVTLNLGLRYEPESNPVDAFGTIQNALNLPLSASYNPALPMPGCYTATVCPGPGAIPFLAGITGYTPIHTIFLKNPSFKNFDPRIGIAWDPFRDHKTSVRAGYGIFHSPVTAYDYTMGFTNTPAGTAVTQSCSAASPCSNFPTPFQTAGSFSPSLDGGIDSGIKQTPYMQQYNLTIQREIAKNTTVSLGYVGSRGVHLIGFTDENPPLPTGAPGAITVCSKVPATGIGVGQGCTLTPGQVLLPYPAIGSFLTSGACNSVGVNNIPTCAGLTAGAGPVSATGAPIVDPSTGQRSYSNVVYNPSTGTYSVVANNRIDPAIGFWNLERTTFWSVYNSLQAGLVRRLTNNAQVQLSYTYASCVTNSSGTTGFEGQIVGSNSYNVNADRGSCAFLVRHNFYANGMYILPFHKNRLVAGWQLGGIFQYHTGTPMFVGNGWFSGIQDRSGSATTDDRPSVVPNCQQVIATLAHWINTACFSQPPIGEPGNVGMNTVFGPDSMTFDTSLVKNTRISERFNVQFRAEFFNLFNRTNLRNAGQPAIPVFSQANTVHSYTGGAGTGLASNCYSTPSACSIVSGTAGLETLTNTTARQIQFGLKVLF